jgi:hypothetical protein
LAYQHQPQEPPTQQPPLSSDQLQLSLNAVLFGLLGGSTIYFAEEGKLIGSLWFGFTAIGTIWY